MSRMVQATQRAAASAQRIFEILDRVPSVAEPVRPVHPAGSRGEIELRERRLPVRQPRRSCDGINLTIQPGEMIGLVGPSGAGKSTLVNLVCRFYDVDRRRDPRRRHRHPLVPRRASTAGTSASCCRSRSCSTARSPRTSPTASPTRRATRSSPRPAPPSAHEFILRLPDGYDSLVGERGQSLSGGERQRISIARALLIDPRILILDEATSSVDTETEREIQEALDNLIRGRTTIAIAHRLSTLRKADRLVVLERGRIAEIGTARRAARTPAELRPAAPGPSGDA